MPAVPERPSARPLQLIGDGVMLAADALGDPEAPTVLLFHGGGQTRHSWAGAQRHIAQAGWHAVSVDLRGHGDSEWSPHGDYRIHRFAGDIEAVARRFDRPVLVGASLGGISSMWAASSAGDAELTRGLVLVDVAPHIERAGASRIGEFMMSHMTDGFATLDEVADAIQAYNPHRPRPQNLAGLRRNLRERDGRWFWHWDPAFVTGNFGSPDETRLIDHRLAFDATALDSAASRLTVPTLLVRGRESDLLSPEGAAAFLALVPHAQFVDVAGAGHMVAGDRNDAFNTAIVEFLAGLTPGVTPSPAAQPAG